MSREQMQSHRSSRSPSGAARRTVAVLTAAAAWAFLAAPAMAQQVTVFSDDFESYTTGSSLPNGGATDLWSAISSGATTNVTVEQGASSQYLYLHGSTAASATTSTIDARGVDGNLTFDLRYTGNNGDFAVDSTSDNGLNFDEFDGSPDDIWIQYDVGSGFTFIDDYTWNDTAYRNGFAVVSLALPSGALRSTLQIRFIQITGATSNADQWAIDNVVVSVTTPEPGTWALFGMSVAGLGAWVQRRRRARRAAK